MSAWRTTNVKAALRNRHRRIRNKPQTHLFRPRIQCRLKHKDHRNIKDHRLTISKDHKTECTTTREDLPRKITAKAMPRKISTTRTIETAKISTMDRIST
jgi:hypothetical protein